jgi:hypothetical protein
MMTFLLILNYAYLRLAIVLSFIFCIHQHTVQSQVKLGIKSGGNFATATTLPLPIFDKSLTIIQPPTSPASLNLGVFADIPIAESLSFVTGLDYGEKHIFTSSMTIIGTISPNLLGFFNSPYLEAPLLLKYTLKSSIQPYLIAGIFVRKALSASSTIQVRDIVLQREDITINVLESIQSVEWGVQTGVGLSYEFMPRYSIFIDGRFLYGFTNTTKAIDWQASFTREVRLCIGLSYQF